MTRRPDSLRVRLILAFVAVVFVGVVTVLVATWLLTPAFIEDHVRLMEEVMGPDAASAVTDFEEGVLTGFGQALFIGTLVSTIAALTVGLYASNRLLRPIERIRTATRRMASGAYNERIDPPPEPELAALTEDVNELARSLDETEERRRRLIGEVAHELRTPLATITGYMEGLIDGVFEPTDEVFAATARETARLSRLADDLTELSRIEEGADELHFALLDATEVVADAVAQFERRFAAKGIALTAVLSPPAMVRADRDRLTQVLMNVIGNGLTYTDEGGSVTVAAAAQADRVAISVSDTGAGLAPDEIDRVFDRFYRADRRVQGGAGIGLTIARRLVEAHHGTLSVSSAGKGLGSTFTIDLPAAGD